MRKLIIIFIIFTTPLFAAKVERLGFYNIQELLEDDNLTYKIIKSCVSLNSAITEITREDHPELSKSFFATANYLYPFGILTLAKIKKKKKVTIWGSGKPKRELMFVNDFAEAVIFFMNKNIREPFINIGTGENHSIIWYTKFLMKKLNVKLEIKFDKSKPDGTPKKCLDITLAKKYGWKPKNNFNEGIKITYDNFLSN